MKHSLLILLTLLVASCGQSSPPSNLADGVGNGGSITVDGETYHLADLNMVPADGELFVLDDALFQDLHSMNLALGRWAFTESKRFFAEFVLNDAVMYKFVKDLPSGCDDAPIPVPNGMEAHVFACTKGYITYIIPKYFVHLSFDEKGAAIIHERLHAFAPQQPHEIISPFIQDYLTFRRLLNDRFTALPLKDTDLQSLKRFRRGARQLGLSPILEHIQILNGGGLCWEKPKTLDDSRATDCASISSDAWVNIQSIITGQSKIPAASQIADSYLDSVTFLFPMHLQGGTFQSSYFENGVTFTRPMTLSWTDIDPLPMSLPLQNGVRLSGPITLTNSTFVGYLATTAPSTIENSDAIFPWNCRLTMATIKNSKVTMNDCYWNDTFPSLTIIDSIFHVLLLAGSDTNIFINTQLHLRSLSVSNTTMENLAITLDDSVKAKNTHISGGHFDVAGITFAENIPEFIDCEVVKPNKFVTVSKACELIVH